MELKVWVEGVSRVVCGLAPNTSCQDVVIALAQSIGQTGRYVLILKLRGNERQLLAADCPLQLVAQLGQQAAEVQFILRRTGPSLRDKAASKRLRPPSRTSEPESIKQKESHRARTDSQGSSTLPRRTKGSRARSSSSTASPEPRASPVPFLDFPSSGKAFPSFVSKEDVFRQILQQQKMLQDLDFDVQALERETEVLERLTSSATVPGLSLDLREELEKLERRQMQNKEELIVGEQWEELLQAEMDKEQDMHRRLTQIRSSVDGRMGQISELQVNSAQLEQEVQLTVQMQRAAARQSEEALRVLEQKFNDRQQQTQQLEATLSASQRELEAAERMLQDKLELVQVLNKELRQCNLQQFIQQTGGPHADPTNLPLTEVYRGSPVE